jgi:LysM domain
VPPATAKSGPRTYTVRRGDSLSILAQRFTGDPMGWPKLWALNPDIPNPHWIRPGQVIRVSGPPAKEEKISAVPEAADASRARPASSPLGGTRVMSHPAPVQPVGPRLRQLGFVDEGTFQAAGTINGSPEEKVMLATGDRAYVQFPQGQAPKPPARYSVYQVDSEHPVREPGSSLVIGYLVHVAGEIVIDDEGSDRSVSSGHLVNLAEPVERGYRVGPLLPDMRQVAPKASEVSLSGRVIAAFDPGSMISSQTFVIVNRGRRHGVEPGNRFLVTRQGDGLKRMLEGWDTMDPNFPPHTVAEILAVDVRDETTVGWVSRGERELRVGDVVDLQSGY